jgi:hypothetical protein
MSTLSIVYSIFNFHFSFFNFQFSIFIFHFSLLDMCGYCIERKPIEISADQAAGKTWEKGGVTFYLQECHDLISALRNQSVLDRLMHELELINKSPELTFGWHNELVVFCRIIETLVKYGFNSEAYCQLISNPFALKAVENQAKRQPSFDERFFSPDSTLKKLFNRDMFLVKELWEEITLNNPFLLEDCISLLNSYIDWWQVESTGNSKDDKRSYGVFLEIYPYVFFSLMIVSTDRNNDRLGTVKNGTFNINTPINPFSRCDLPQFDASVFRSSGCVKPPNCLQCRILSRLINMNCEPPLPDGMELWLQRKASLILFDWLRLTAFLPYQQPNTWHRPVLIYYLLVNNKLNEEEKVTLQEEIIRANNNQIPQNKIAGPFWASIDAIIIEHLKMRVG